MTMRTFRILVISGIVSGAFASAAAAKTCAPEEIAAKGEPARYMWLAKTKARANWRSKVRRTPGLGPKYANWNLAESTEERCASGPSGTLCTFSGRPCLP